MPTLQDYDNAIKSATSAVTSATATAQSALADLNRCNCGKGKTYVKTQGYPAGTCAPLTSQVSFPNLANPAACIPAPNVNNCKTDCCSNDTCVARVNAYNSAIGVYNTAVQNLATANKAKADAIATDPNIKNEEANRKRRNGVIYVVVIGVILVVLTIVYFKYKK